MRKGFFIAGIILSIGAIVFLILTLQQGCVPQNVLSEPTPKYIIRTETTPEPDEEYKSPVDFEMLWKDTTDVAAWLDIPGTYISYPVMQDKEDDNFYLRHDYRRNYMFVGSLFTEHRYNNPDFSDSVTVVYGHHTVNGSMFGDLEKLYSDPDTFKNLNKIIVYLPDKEYHYTVFAAVPYNPVHIMSVNYKFKDKTRVPAFAEEVLSVADFSTNFDRSIKVDKDDKLIVLSTCLSRNRYNRYLVVGKLTEVID